MHPVFVEFVVDLELEENIMLELFKSIEEYYNLVREINFYIHKKDSLECMIRTNGILATLLDKDIISPEDFENGLEMAKKAFQDEITELEQKIEKAEAERKEIKKALAEQASSEKEDMGELFDYLFGEPEHEK